MTTSAAMPTASPVDFDAVLVVSFGGPEGPDQVMPFLRNVTGGRVSDAALEPVARHYRHFGGVSPINDLNRALCAALEAELRDAGLPLPVMLGNRHWHPFARDAVAELARAGARNVAVVVTSGYSSFAGCRWYQQSLAADVRGAARLASGPMELHKIRLWFDHPLFLDMWADRVGEAFARVEARAELPLLLATTHSLPTEMAEASGHPDGPSGSRAGGRDGRGGAYVAQHEFVSREVARRLSARLGRHIRWELAFQSQAGPATADWLGPDVNERVRQLARAGVSQIVLAPIGFVSDHMEILWDLDIACRRTADEAGIEMTRAETIGTDPRFARMLADLVLERARGTDPADRPAASTWGPWPDECAPDCCPAAPDAAAAAAVGSQSGRTA